ncbi:DoxX family protein [Kocuria himachalensis]
MPLRPPQTRSGADPRGVRSGAAAARALRMGAALCGAGVLHLVRPAPFDGLIPRSLPGSARAWTVGSGVAELGVGALLLHPGTRRAGGWAAAALFVGVWPGNVTMAWRARRGSRVRRAVTLVRLPLQVPLIAGALRIARAG